MICQLAMRTCTNTIPAPLPLANLLLYRMDTIYTNLCSISAQSSPKHLCVKMSLGTAHAPRFKLYKEKMPLARNSKTQLIVSRRAHSQSEQRMLQHYSCTVYTQKMVLPRSWTASCDEPIPLSSGVAVMPDEVILCVQPTVVAEAPLGVPLWECELEDVALAHRLI